MTSTAVVSLAPVEQESVSTDELAEVDVPWITLVWNDPVNRTGQGNAQMWYNVTRDFQTFSEPQVWQNPFPQSRIDTTALKVGDYYYRVTKNEAGNAGSDLFSEKHTDFLDSNIENWELPGGIQNKLHLLARRIVIAHPRTGKPIDVTAPLPPHMQQSFDLLGLDTSRYDPIVEAPEE